MSISEGQKINIFVVVRIIIGLVFLLSGGSKLLSHYQNFLYVIQGYEVLPPALEKAAALIVPWIELLTGIFLVLGLWLRWALRSALVLFTAFVVVVGQALLRNIPLAECGCFGSWITFSPQMMIVLDSLFLILTVRQFFYFPKASQLSLDRYFSRPEKN